MGDIVIRQDIEILRRQIILVPDLDGVPEPARQRLEERIEPARKSAGVGKVYLLNVPNSKISGPT